MRSASDLSMEKRITESAFVPARWLRNRHLQTIFPILPWVHGPRPALLHEALELPDGDITAVDWLVNDQAQDDRPLLVILHGLEGSAASPYCRHLLRAAATRDWNAAVLQFRDCGDFRNRLPRRYHAGETDDLRYFLELVRRRGYTGPLLATGYSLGGNVLLKYLGESGTSAPLVAATAVSAPLDLHVSAAALQVGFARIYQSYLLKRMKNSVVRKFNPDTAAFDWHRALAAQTFAEFDDAVTAPLHGFSGKDDYYDRCSAGHFLSRIEKPTLILNALDDPFMTPDVIPAPEDIGDHVTLEISKHGGHVGFVNGGTPWRPRYFLPDRILRFFDSIMAGQLTDT